MRSLGSLHAGAGRRGGSAAFDPLTLPWLHYWDMTLGSPTVSGSPLKVTALGDLGTGAAAMTSGVSTGPTYTANWRNGHPSHTPAATGILASAGAGTGAQPFTCVFVGQFISDPGVGDSFRILMCGAATGDSNRGTVFYCQDVGVTHALRTHFGSEVTHFASITAWAGLPFIAIVEANGASSRLDMRIHGISPVSATGWNPGTRVMQELKWGAGLAAGLWNAPLAVAGIITGTLTSDQRSYLFDGYGERYDIVPS